MDRFRASKKVMDVLNECFNEYPDMNWTFQQSTTEETIEDGWQYFDIEFELFGERRYWLSEANKDSRTVEDENFFEAFKGFDLPTLIKLVEVIHQFSLTPEGQKLQDRETAVGCFKLLTLMGELALSTNGSVQAFELGKSLGNTLLDALGKD